MRIGVTYDLRSDYLALGYGEEETAEFDAEETIAAICAALTGLGHDPIRIGGIHPLAKALVAGERWDAVFNICEGLKGVAREAQVPALLEAFDIPYLFSDPLTLALSLDKALAKRVVRDAGVPTADFALIENENDIAKVALDFPLFLKPVSEGSGKGVDARSKVDTAAELQAVAKDLLARFRQPVLVEEFLPGREFTGGNIGAGAGACVLGVSEIVPQPEGRRVIAMASRTRKNGKTSSPWCVGWMRRHAPRATWRWRPGGCSSAATAVGLIYGRTNTASRHLSRSIPWPGCVRAIPISASLPILKASPINN